MALVACVKCGHRISTRLPKCPQCGTQQPRAASVVTSQRVSDALAWAKKWAVTGGLFLVAGFLIPIPIPQHNGVGALWQWDVVIHAPLGWAIGLSVPPLAGLAVLGMALFGPRRLLPWIMIVVGGSLLGLAFALSLLVGYSFAEQGQLWAASWALSVILAVIASFGIAAANHVRKVHSRERAPRLLSMVCGGLGVLVFLLPLSGRPPLFLFFQGIHWTMLGPTLVGLMGCFAYGVAGIVNFRNWRNPTRAGLLFSIAGRVTFLLLPLSIVAYGIMDALPAYRAMKGQAPAVLVVLKLFLTAYGVLLLPWAGVAAVMIDWLHPAAPPRVTAPTESPVAA